MLPSFIENVAKHYGVTVEDITYLYKDEECTLVIAVLIEDKHLQLDLISENHDSILLAEWFKDRFVEELRISK